MKNTEYRIKNYHIDFSRNQITVEGESNILPPKAMAVLEVLILSQGKVISVEYLLEKVWVDAVVTVNTLHRCISQLRKVFKDDSKLQRVIKTHAKQGYSLIIPAIIQDTSVVPDLAPNLALNPELTSEKQMHSKKTVVGIIGGLFLTIILFFSVEQPFTNQNKNYTHIKSLTSSDDNEAYGSYSPNGRFIVFQRNIDACYSDLWAKDLVSKKEFKLTSREGVYGQPDWSPDGNHLVFIERNSCPQKNRLKTHCWSVNTIGFASARAAPQNPSRILECNKHYTKKAQWLLDGEISFLQENDDNNMSLKRYNPRTGETLNIYTPKEQYIYSFDYSLNQNQYAVLSFSATNEHKIEVINARGKLLSSHNIEMPKGVSIYKTMEAEYHPTADYLITATSQGVFKFYPNGEFELVPLAQRHGLYNPSFHPDGERIIATEVHADTDNILLNLEIEEFKTTDLTSLLPYQIARSNMNDDFAIFQPLGNGIAFTSKRTDIRQLWFKKENDVFQLSDVEFGIQKKGIAWSPSGNKIASLVDNQVNIFSVNKTREKVKSKHQITEIMQWPLATKLLVKALSLGEEGLYYLDLKTDDLTVLAEKEVAWASYLSNTEVIYLDSNNQFWVVDKEEKKEIKALFEQLERPYFAVDNQFVFGINKQRELWRYSLDTDKLKIIKQLPFSTRYVSDVNNKRVLITHMKEFRKELVELH